MKKPSTLVSDLTSRGLTQSEIATLTGLSQGYVSKILNKKVSDVRYSVILKLQRALYLTSKKGKSK
jgi:transcriptional regulator with XRE-family HTH domain|nr:MAG TPA: putative Cro-like protein [Caudoviricetes sp.]